CCSFFFSSRRRHTRFSRDWSSDVCSSDLDAASQHRLLRGKPCVAALDPVKTELPSQIESLFVRHPALCGFSVLGLEDVPDNCPRSEERRVGNECRPGRSPCPANKRRRHLA